MNGQLTDCSHRCRLAFGGNLTKVERLGENESARRELVGVERSPNLAVAAAVVADDGGEIGFEASTDEGGAFNLDRPCDVRGTADRLRSADRSKFFGYPKTNEGTRGVLEGE
jgi:hypothetical protein